MRSIRIVLFVQVLFCLPPFAIAQPPASGKFILMGIINGNAPAQLKLRYADSAGKWRLDSAVVNQGRFEFRGVINGPTISQIMGKLTSKTTDDPNYTSIFLEPGLMEIEVTVDDFQSVAVKGSLAQSDYQKLNETERQLSVVRAPLLKAISALDKEIAIRGKSNQLQARMDSLDSRWSTYANSITENRLRFIRTNGSSAVAANLIPAMIYSNVIPVDSAEIIYSKFSQAIKNSMLGKAVQTAIRGKRAVVIGNHAPMFSGVDINGKPACNEDYIGKKYVLLNFWASWCAPCHEEMPYLNKLYNKYGKSGLEMISISIDRDRSAWKKDIKKSKIGRWKHMLILDDKISGDVGDRFGFGGIPVILLIDKSGIIVYRSDGFGGEGDMRKLDTLIHSNIKN